MFSFKKRYKNSKNALYRDNDDLVSDQFHFSIAQSNMVVTLKPYLE